MMPNWAARLAATLAISLFLHLGLVLLLGVKGSGIPQSTSKQPAKVVARLHLADASPVNATTLREAVPDASAPWPLPMAQSVLAPRQAGEAALAENATPNAQAAAGLISPLPAPQAEAPRYYLAREVDQPVEPFEHVPLQYPEAALRQRIGGTVLIRVFVNASGQVDRTEVVRSHPPGVFEQAVIDAVRAMRFRPALLNQQPVNARITLEVPFDPNCDDYESCGSMRR